MMSDLYLIPDPDSKVTAKAISKDHMWSTAHQADVTCKRNKS
jgi:hypothetical protein